MERLQRWDVAEPEDPYSIWSLSDRLQMLAFEAELAHLPRPLITAIWEVIDHLDPKGIAALHDPITQ